MHSEDENIILFPKWKDILKDESLQDLQAKRYEEALGKLNELIQYNVQDYEILIGKLMCLMELGRYQEAEDMCENIIQDKNNEQYFHYVHLYLTILFQSNKYELLMEKIEEELSSDNLPSILREQFLQLYDVSEKMETDLVEKKTSVYIEELLDAVQLSDHRKQWRSLMRLKTMNIKPENVVVQLLEHDDVHPVMKTAIFNWLKEHSYAKVVKVRKLGQELLINPVDISEIKELDMYRDIMFQLQNIEQNNPSMYTFLADSLYRYIYVRYPILPPSEDTELIAEALKSMYLLLLNSEAQQSSEFSVMHYMDEIMKGEKLYLSIIED